MRKIGLLIPKTNLTVEHELQYLFNKNILDCNDYIFYTAKLDYKTSYKENKEQYLKDLAEDSNNKIEDLKYLDVDYVGYFCTYLTFLLISFCILSTFLFLILECA